MQDVTHRDTCRLCESKKLELVLPILPSAIGDAFVSADQLNETQGIYPLDTYICLECGHLQNLDFVNPEILFRNYTYRTSASLGLVEHFRQYADSVITNLAIQPGSLVVEIGSNDGSLLKAYKSHGMIVQGVDPARNIAALATAEGIPTKPDFFSMDIALEILHNHGHASIVCANNVFAHADNMCEIVKGIRQLLNTDGVFVFEVSYVPDIIDNFVFDTIYHEHVSHHALIPLERFFNKLDMTLFDVERVSTKGGSIRGYAQAKSTGNRQETARLKELYAIEEKRGIAQPEIYRQFYKDIQIRKEKTLAYLQNAKSQGKTIAAYGASTTTTTLIYHFELGSLLHCIFDDNPIKQGLFSPGLHLPVLPSTEIYTKNPDIIVIVAWVYAKHIIKRHTKFIEEGGVFIIPLPDMTIIA